jgi:SAM-dependent methyltransferase
MKEHYTGRRGEEYFEKRRGRRRDGVQRKAAGIFMSYIQPSDTVIDFGCGTGGILETIPCGRRIGIEINEASVQAAREKGVEVFTELSEVAEESADVVITHHALEHVPNPLEILCELRGKLKPGGRIVVVVPWENPRKRRNRTWHEEDAKHLFCWTPLTLGNLLAAAGYEVEEGFVYALSGTLELHLPWVQSRPRLLRALRYLQRKICPQRHVLATGRTAAEGGQSQR